MEITLLDKTYELLEVISETEKSSVYLVTDESRELYIVKELEGEEQLPLINQICDLKLGCLPQILEVKSRDGKVYLLEEYLEGESLYDILQKESIQKEDGLLWMKQLMQAVQALHGLQPPILHRDIKPENLIIKKNKELILLDLDAARFYDISQDKERDTRLLGTRGYAAPEQFGFSQTDGRSDIYSVGIVCAEIIKKMDAEEILKKRLMSIVDKATMFDPGKRYQSMDEMLDEFQREQKAGKSKGYLWGIAVASLLLLCIGLGTLIWRHREQSAEEQTEVSYVVSEYYDDAIFNNDEYPMILIKAFLEPEELHKVSKRIEAPIFTFYKEYPQGLLFYDTALEQWDLQEIYLERHDRDTGFLVEKLHVIQGEDAGIEDGYLFARVSFLQNLKSGFYELELSNTAGEEYQINIHVVDAFEEVPYEPTIMVQGGYYIKAVQNDVFFNVLGTPSVIERVECQKQVLDETEYLLTKDRKGVLLKPSAFEHSTEEKIPIVLHLQDGKAIETIVYMK